MIRRRFGIYVQPPKRPWRWHSLYNFCVIVLVAHIVIFLFMAGLLPSLPKPDSKIPDVRLVGKVAMRSGQSAPRKKSVKKPAAKKRKKKVYNIKPAARPRIEPVVQEIPKLDLPQEKYPTGQTSDDSSNGNDNSLFQGKGAGGGRGDGNGGGADKDQGILTRRVYREIQSVEGSEDPGARRVWGYSYQVGDEKYSEVRTLSSGLYFIQPDMPYILVTWPTPTLKELKGLNLARVRVRILIPGTRSIPREGVNPKVLEVKNVEVDPPDMADYMKDMAVKCAAGTTWYPAKFDEKPVNEEIDLDVTLKYFPPSQ